MENMNEIKGNAQVKLPHESKEIDRLGNVDTMFTHHHQQQSVITSAWYFVRHFLEMCVLVMCIGGVGILSALLRWAGPLIGYSDLKTQFPEVVTVVLALWMTLLMIIWMRIRGHEWRQTLEMASTSIVALPLVLGAAGLGIIARSSLYGLECGLACALMLVPMLFRLEHYTGRMDHSMHTAHH